MGLDPDLDDAAKQALREMIRWLVELKGWSSEEAYVFCSLACDLRVTQLVDGNKGIHAMVERRLSDPIDGEIRHKSREGECKPTMASSSARDTTG